MTFLVVGLIVLVLITIGCGILAFNDSYSCWDIATGIFSTVTFIYLIIVVILGVDWKSSQYKADLINREYNTNYTKEEIFYAEDAIETIQQIKRTRIDIQGLNSDN